MNRLSFLIIGGLAVVPHCVWAKANVQWAPLGVVVSSGAGFQGNTTGGSNPIPFSGNEFVIFWEDWQNDYSSGTLRARKIGLGGDALWDIDISTNFIQSSKNLVNSSDDAFIAAWTVKPPGQPAEYLAQKISRNGDATWISSGVVFGVTTGVFAPAGFMYAIGDDNGGMIATWMDEAIMAQKVDADGNPQWGEGIVVSVSSAVIFSQPVPDGNGGAIAAWNHYSDAPPFDVYIQRIRYDGSLLWGPGGVRLTDLSANQTVPILVADGSGGAIIAWKDERNGNWDIYAQRVDADGTALWAANGVPVCVAEGDQEAPRMVPDNQGGAFMVWRDNRSGNFDIYAQRLDSSGRASWIFNGVPVAVTTSNARSPRIVTDGSGGIYAAWSDDTGSYTDGGVHIQHIDKNGTALWGTNGYLLAGGATAQYVDDIGTGSTGELFAAWLVCQDPVDCADGDLYMQKILDDGEILLPPSALQAVSMSGRRIGLDWQASPSPNVAGYFVYFDSASGTIDYSSKIASVTHPATAFTTETLMDGQVYRFGIRAVDPSGFEDGNIDVVAQAAAKDDPAGAVQAAIRVPQAGMKLTGNRTLVMAEIVQGGLSDVRSVLFQYRGAVSTSSSWTDIIQATPQHPNPDTNSPYFVHFDISAFSEGVYELRALVTSQSGATDPAPATIFVTIDHADPQVEETALGSGIRKRQTVNNTTSNTIQAGGGQDGSLIKLILPADSLNSSAATLKIVTEPAGLPAVPRELASGGSFSEITLESGQTQLLNDRLAAMTVFYPDADNDGIVDGTVARADRLALYVYDPAAGNWERLAGSVDTGQRTVFAQTSHFSLFGLFAPAAADLSDVLVYPVPWVPNDGIADNGKPYNSADPDSGIIFDNITQSARIQIYTITGELVWEKTTDASSGKVQWDGRNRSGRNAASGGYFAVITDTATGGRVTRKIAVIR